MSSPNNTRRAHTKSRRGCLNCKRRRVKCDETRPVCEQCYRLDLTCEWRPSNPQHVTPQSTPSDICDHNQITTPPAPPPPTGNSINQPRLHTDDLQLLHHWMLNTSHACAQSGQLHVWQHVIVEIGFRHTFVLRGILALAAVHKAGIFEAESSRLCLQATDHMTAAIAVFRDHLDSPDPTTSIPVFALAVILPLYRLGLAQVQTPSEPIQTLCEYMRLTKGVQASSRQQWDRVVDSALQPIIRTVYHQDPTESDFPELVHLRQFAIKHTAQQIASEDVRVIAIDELRRIACGVAHCDEAAGHSTLGTTFSWAATLPFGFYDLIQSGDGIALLVFAHFAVLLHRQRRHCWVRNWGLWLLNDIERVLPDNLRPWLDWPRAHIGTYS